MRNYDISQQNNAKACTENYSMHSYLLFLEENMRQGITAPTFNRPKNSCNFNVSQQ